jgi:hypothetical protein
MYQKIATLFENGTLPNLELYVGKIAIGRCFERNAPNKPYFSGFSTYRKFSHQDSGPLGPNISPLAQYEIREIQISSTINFNDDLTYVYSQEMASLIGKADQIDGRSYLVNYDGQARVISRQNGKYVVSYVSVPGPFPSIPGNEYYCYYYRVNN